MTTIEGDIILLETRLPWTPTWLISTSFGQARWSSNFFLTPILLEILLRAIDYITSKVSCITFREATELVDIYVLTQDCLQCKSELGQTGGVQKLDLNR